MITKLYISRPPPRPQLARPSTALRRAATSRCLLLLLLPARIPFPFLSFPSRPPALRCPAQPQPRPRPNPNPRRVNYKTDGARTQALPENDFTPAGRHYGSSSPGELARRVSDCACGPTAPWGLSPCIGLPPSLYSEPPVVPVQRGDRSRPGSSSSGGSQSVRGPPNRVEDDWAWACFPLVDGGWASGSSEDGLSCRSEQKRPANFFPPVPGTSTNSG